MAMPTSFETSVEIAPSREDLIRAYRAMYVARRLDDREILLKRQNRILQTAAPARSRAGRGRTDAQGRARLVLSLIIVTAR